MKRKYMDVDGKKKTRGRLSWGEKGDRKQGAGAVTLCESHETSIDR